ncbi:hypothetical protein [Verrucomicrobium sp. BvORR106]|uniref:hypothetical protein n=1 Tax=Verrucomicrobium sp. BvORR106 TaxID=1403819 RepID=UPI00056F1D65|nr:hypothetical protein [Verrucomicrobium sp. BvORR106]
MLAHLHLPDIVFANMGTPLMWMTLLHLFIGNAVIALFEGLLLAACFKIRRLTAVGYELLANYASAWLGAWIFPHHFPGTADVNITNLHTWLWQGVFLAFMLTLVVESPFIWLGLRKRSHPVRSTLLGVLLVNTISYPPLAVLYLSSSSTSMLTQLEIAAPNTSDTPKDLRLYFLSPEGNQVLQTDLTGTPPVMVKSLPALPAEQGRHLYALPTTPRSFDLMLLTGSNRKQVEEWHLQTLLANFSSDAGVEPEVAHDMPSPGPSPNRGPASRMAPSAGAEDSYQVGSYANEGIRKWGSRPFHFALETPFAMWHVRHATQVSDDLVIFQLGKDQICLLRPYSGKITLLARGQSPVVAR